MGKWSCWGRSITNGEHNVGRGASVDEAEKITQSHNRDVDFGEERIGQVVEDDELVAYGPIHIERMDDDCIWFDVCGRSFTISAVGFELKWSPQDPGTWDE